MADFIFDLDYIRNTLSPGATPNDTDLIFAQKADGTPVVYTLAELAAHNAGVAAPAWLTDAKHGCFLRTDVGDGSFLYHNDGSLVPFSRVISDSGFYVSNGVITIPVGVTEIEITASIEAVGTNIELAITGGALGAHGKSVGANGIAQIYSGPIAVSAGETYGVTLSGSNSINVGLNSFMKVRTTEKLI